MFLPTRAWWLWCITLPYLLVQQSNPLEISTEQPNPNPNSNPNRHDDQPYEVIDVAQQSSLGGAGQGAGQTTRIFTNGEVDDSFWLKYLGEDFRHAIHLQVGGNDRYDGIYNMTDKNKAYQTPDEYQHAKVDAHTHTQTHTHSHSHPYAIDNSYANSYTQAAHANPVDGTKNLEPAKKDAQKQEPESNRNSTAMADHGQQPAKSESNEKITSPNDYYGSNSNSNNNKDKSKDKHNDDNNTNNNQDSNNNNNNNNNLYKSSYERILALDGGGLHYNNNFDLSNREPQYKQKYTHTLKGQYNNHKYAPVYTYIRPEHAQNRYTKRGSGSTNARDRSATVVVNLPDTPMTVQQMDDNETPIVVKMPPVIYHSNSYYRQQEQNDSSNSSSDTNDNNNNNNDNGLDTIPSTYGNSNSNTDADADTDTDTNSKNSKEVENDTHTHTNAQTETDTSTDTDTDTNTNTNTNTNTYTHTYSEHYTRPSAQQPYSHTNAMTPTYPDAHQHAHTHLHVHTHAQQPHHSGDGSINPDADPDALYSQHSPYSSQYSLPNFYSPPLYGGNAFSAHDAYQSTSHMTSSPYGEPIDYSRIARSNQDLPYKEGLELL